jgi:hypothetical protein
MGNPGTKLSWSWPLISIEWLPEVLQSIPSLIEPTWSGLQRQMTLETPNPGFGNRMFHQLRTMLTEIELVRETGNHICSTVAPDSDSVRGTLLRIYMTSSAPWAKFHRSLAARSNALVYLELREGPPSIWPEIASYPIFKQWTELFSFLGLGVLLKPDVFLPAQLLAPMDLPMLEKAIISWEDPHRLTGRKSLHTGADYLLWTKGETILPLTDDPAMHPRIPLQPIADALHHNSADGEIGHSATEAVQTWFQSICFELASAGIPNLDRFIVSSKQFLDYFVFGRAAPLTDVITRDEFEACWNVWDSVQGFSLSAGVRRHLPNVFRDTTRLYWGIAYYRNSLRRPTRDEILLLSELDQSRLGKLRLVPIRCSRSRRGLCSIAGTVMPIVKSIQHLVVKDIGISNERLGRESIDRVTSFFPSKTLEVEELLSDLRTLLNCDRMRYSQIGDLVHITLPDASPTDPILHACYWIHRQYDLVHNSTLALLDQIVWDIDEHRRKLLDDMHQAEQGVGDWVRSCERLRIRTLNVGCTE